MSRGSPALTAARKEEIIEACSRLYETMSFKEITIKEIGAATSFTRTSIYNYFETKEEIFLALLQREYELWVDTMNAVMAEKGSMTRDELAQTMARTLTDRPRLLRLLSMNLYDMEANSRPEQLAKFKVAYGSSLDAVTRMVKKYIPEMRMKRCSMIRVWPVHGTPSPMFWTGQRNSAWNGRLHQTCQIQNSERCSIRVKYPASATGRCRILNTSGKSFSRTAFPRNCFGWNTLRNAACPARNRSCIRNTAGICRKRR